MISSISCKDICEFRKIWLNAPDGEMVLSPLDIVHCCHSVVILSSAAIQWTGPPAAAAISGLNGQVLLLGSDMLPMFDNVAQLLGTRRRCQQFFAK